MIKTSVYRSPDSQFRSNKDHFSSDIPIAFHIITNVSSRSAYDYVRWNPSSMEAGGGQRQGTPVSIHPELQVHSQQARGRLSGQASGPGLGSAGREEASVPLHSTMTWGDRNTAAPCPHVAARA